MKRLILASLSILTLGTAAVPTLAANDRWQQERQDTLNANSDRWQQERQDTLNA